MWGRLAKITLGTGMREKAEQLADQAVDSFVELNGFVSVAFFMHDEDKGEYGSLSIWETREDAEAAEEALQPRLKEAAGDFLKAPPQISMVEIYLNRVRKG